MDASQGGPGESQLSTVSIHYRFFQVFPGSVRRVRGDDEASALVKRVPRSANSMLLCWVMGSACGVADYMIEPYRGTTYQFRPPSSLRITRLEGAVAEGFIGSLLPPTAHA